MRPRQVAQWCLSGMVALNLVLHSLLSIQAFLYHLFFGLECCRLGTTTGEGETECCDCKTRVQNA